MSLPTLSKEIYYNLDLSSLQDEVIEDYFLSFG